MVDKLMGLWLFFDALVAAIIITDNGTDTIIICHNFLLSSLFYCNQTKIESKKIFSILILTTIFFNVVVDVMMIVLNICRLMLRVAIATAAKNLE